MEPNLHVQGQRFIKRVLNAKLSPWRLSKSPVAQPRCTKQRNAGIMLWVLVALAFTYSILCCWRANLAAPVHLGTIQESPNSAFVREDRVGNGKLYLGEVVTPLFTNVIMNTEKRLLCCTQMCLPSLSFFLMQVTYSC